tara:strand:- start:1789 stop:2514 length:726 start_codon:yes stop_codon:yes gene_type:complete
MKKRGATHIDWVISIGIFIVYVLILLVWIKPSYKPVFEEESLITIIKHNIEKDHSIEVGKTLLILEGCTAAGNKETFTLSNYLPGLGVGNFDVIKVIDNTRALYKSGVTIGLYDASLRNEYWIIGSDDFNNYGSNPGNLDSLGEDPTCTVSIGETILKKGLSDTTLSGFNPSSWGFPGSRDFKIILSDFGDTEICYNKQGSVDCDSYQPDSGAIVYSNEWRYNVLDKDWGTEAVLIVILVW